MSSQSSSTLVISKQDSITSSLIPTANDYPSTTGKSTNKKIAISAVALFLIASACIGYCSTSVENSQLQVDPIVLAHIAEELVIPIAEENIPKTRDSSRKQAYLNIENDGDDSAINESSSGAPYVPTTFDLHTKASAAGCDFSVIDEMLCIGGNWSHAIATTISNTVCLAKVAQLEIPLSSQYILDCSTLKNKCDILDSRETFELNLGLTQSVGLPTADCVPYNGLNSNIANGKCNTACNDGTDIKINKYAFQDLWDQDDNISTTIQNVKVHLYQTGPVIALLEHSAPIARYSGSGPSGLYVGDSNNNTNFGYRAYKIVGWDLAPSSSTQPILYWIMQNTFSSNWGINGYIRVKANSPIIEGYYAYTPGQ